MNPNHLFPKLIIENSIGRDEQEQLAALNSYDILVMLPEENFDDLAKLASTICQAPISIINLVDPSRQWFEAILYNN